MARRDRRTPVAPLAWVFGATVAILVADVATGGRLQVGSILGYSPQSAGRFFGLGNTAFAVLAMWKNARARIAAVALLGWLFIGVAFAHPDYMAWFNEAAGQHPERIAVDSNLDWGQDWLRFARIVQKRHIDFVRLLYNGNMLLQFHDVRGDSVEPWVEKPGWYGISLQGLTMNPEARRGAWKWLDRYPYEMVGKGIRLYHVP